MGQPDVRLHGRTAVVTGGSRGVGKGIALELISSGARVFVTGRSPNDLEYLNGKGTAMLCDHRDDGQVEAAFRRVLDETGSIDVLVNNVWGGYEKMVEGDVFTWTKPFWEQPRWRWDAMFAAGVRAHYVASQLAAPSMVARKQGLIVNLSFWAARKYIGNVAYGVSKAATDKLTADMAHELEPYRVAVVSLYPGLVRTEKVMQAADWLDLSNSESPQFIGRVVAALAADPGVMWHSGKVVIAAAIARAYGVMDVDGRCPDPLDISRV
jgi:dehydrogenase/reductase SDR family protein 1